MTNDDKHWLGNDYSIRLAEGVTVTFKMDDGVAGEMREHQAHTGIPIWAPWSGDEHFNEWAQTCPLSEWVRYEGPRFSAEVYMTSRPAPGATTPEIYIDEIES